MVTPERGRSRLSRDWLEARAVIVAQHRTLRLAVESTREIARSVMRGEELGVVLIPYLLLGLERTFDTHATVEESLVCPLLEAELPGGRIVAEDLRANHERLRREIRALGQGGRQQAVNVAQQLQVLGSKLLAGMHEEEQVLWGEDEQTRPIPFHC